MREADLSLGKKVVKHVLVKILCTGSLFPVFTSVALKECCNSFCLEKELVAFKCSFLTTKTAQNSVSLNRESLEGGAVH